MDKGSRLIGVIRSLVDQCAPMPCPGQGGTWRTALPVWLVLCATGGWCVCAGEASAIAAGRQTSVYQFQSRSTLLQTGGLAGVHWTYRVGGKFRLAVDLEARTASFEHVEAKAMDDSPNKRTLDPNEVFNMTELAGRVVDETTVSFEGTANDGSSVLFTLTLADGSITLKGQTTPPPHSADYFLFTLDAVARRKYAGGTGEVNNPYLITTAEQLAAIGSEPDTRNQHFLLMNDVDLDPNLPGGRVFDRPVMGVFSGGFDGGAHRIRNLVIDCNREERVGLFGCLGWDGQIRRLWLENASVRSRTSGTGYGTGTLAGMNEGLVEDCHALGYVRGYEYLGGLIGDSLGTIRGCSAYVAVEGDKSFHYAGGLVGWNGGLIVNCRAAGAVNAPAGSSGVGGLVGVMGYLGDVDMGGERAINSCSAGWRVFAGAGCRQIGGLVGLCAEGTITNCYATVDVTGGPNCSRLSGLVGQNGAQYDFGTYESTISNCYAAGHVSTWPDGAEIGGLVGLNEAGEVRHSYWDTEISGQTASDGGIGSSTAQMQNSYMFLVAGWDFTEETKNGTEDIWRIFEGRDYPRLAWEQVLGDDFEDGRAEPLWMLYEPEPQRVWLKEVNGRLDVEAVAQNEDVDAIYVPNGWRLDATRDFALRVDFHFSRRDAGNGRVTLGVVPSLDPAGMQWAEFEIGCFGDRGPLYLYEVSDRSWAQEVTVARVVEDGTLYMSYNSDADELYVSDAGYGGANSWQTARGLLKGRWATEAVYVILSGGSEGMALTAGDAWLDNFVLNAGLVEPSATLPTDASGTLSSRTNP